MPSASEQLVEQAKALLASGEVEVVLGYKRVPGFVYARPLFARTPEQAERLTVDPGCVADLSTYALQLPEKAAVVVKGCDVRSFVGLMQEKQIKPEPLVLIGWNCPGVISERKVRERLGDRADTTTAVRREGDRMVFTLDGGEESFPAAEVVADRCLICNVQQPERCRVVVGEVWPPVSADDPVAPELERLRSATPDERLAFWNEQFARCIRCYACREVCPACYCRECIIDSTRPVWVPRAPTAEDNMIFQQIRMLHVPGYGRCTDCGECERVCPVNLPLRRLTRMLYDDIVRLYKYRHGLDPEAPVPMTVFDAGDSERHMGRPKK